MAKDGLRKFGALALALVSLATAAAINGAGANADDEFAIAASLYSVNDDGPPVALDGDAGPDFAFVDVNNDGIYNGGDYAFTGLSARAKRPVVPKHVFVELDTEGFVVPPRVKTLGADSIEIRSESGRVEIGAGVVVKAKESIVITGGDVVIGERAKVLSEWETYLDAPGGTLEIRDRAKIRAKGGIGENAPDTFVIGENVSLLAPKSEISLLDPDNVMRIGAGTKFVATGIEFGVGLGDDGNPANTFEIGENVSFIGQDYVDIDSFGNNALTFPASTTIKARKVDLLAIDGPLTLSGKVKALSLYLRSNHSVRFDGASVNLGAEGTLSVKSNNSAAPKTTISNTGSKINVGKNGLIDVWSTGPFDAKSIKPAEKTVFVNGVGSGPRARVLTVNVTGAAPTSAVELRVWIGSGQQTMVTCPATTNPCVGSFVKGTGVYVKTSGPKPATIGGACYPANGFVTMSDNRTCTVTFG